MALLLAAPIVLAACGETKLDTGGLEREIKMGYEAKVPGVSVRSVDCPGDIAGKVGTKDECTTHLARGVEIVFAITVKDDDGNVRWNAVRGSAPGRYFEQQAVTQLEQQVGIRPKDIACPARVGLKPGTTVDQR